MAGKKENRQRQVVAGDVKGLCVQRIRRGAKLIEQSLKPALRVEEADREEFIITLDAEFAALTEGIGVVRDTIIRKYEGKKDEKEGIMEAIRKRQELERVEKKA